MHLLMPFVGKSITYYCCGLLVRCFVLLTTSYVYHAMSDATSHQRFEVMERKLYRGIMWPSMIATLITATFL